MTSLSIVLLKIAAMIVPLVILAAKRVFPRRRLVSVALIAAVSPWALFFGPQLLWLVVGIDVLITLVALGDVLTLPRKRSLSVERHAGRIASIRKTHPVSLIVFNHSRRTRFASCRDDVPQELHPEPAEFGLTLPLRSRSTLRYVLRPSRRGAFTIDRVCLRAHSRLGLWQRMLDYGAQTAVNVYPDMQQLSQYALLARTNRLSLLGMRRTRRIGQDHDFERLRDYSIDDNYKHIEWRATARRRKLTVKDFQTSQSQRIIFLMDCGRMMTNQAAGLSLLDHALNAMLMLSYVALRQGDSVGMIAFSDAIHSFVPPRGGMNHMNRLLHASFDRFPQLTESRYDLAFRHLAAHCRKRSLVVLVTSVIDEVNSNQVGQYLTNLVGRHLPLCILLRDRRMFEAVDIEPTCADGLRTVSDERLFAAAASADVLAWRYQVLTDLQRNGAMALDVFPEGMTAPLVNRYLEIKARHLL